jgi:hypothetical protein
MQSAGRGVEVASNVGGVEARGRDVDVPRLAACQATRGGAGIEERASSGSHPA